MGIPLSIPFADIDELNNRFESLLVRSISFGSQNIRPEYRSLSLGARDVKANPRKLDGPFSFNDRELYRSSSIKSPSSNFVLEVSPKTKDELAELTLPENNLPSPVVDSGSHRHEAALKLQKTYKSFRTRRQLADCAIIVEQRWWKLLDFAVLKRSSVSFFEIEKPETAISRWSRARTRAAKVGQGLSKDVKARKLALQHWLEAIDPRHRYGHNLQFYYAKWLHCQSKQPFFYWLDIGEGKEVDADRCSRAKLQQQCIKYLGPMERKAYEVMVENGRFMYKESGNIINTGSASDESKWIFVLSTSKIMYIGLKKKGTFQHSSFLAGGATLSAGRLIIKDGILKAVWPHSGHYLPTQENFEEFMTFLEERGVDLSIVQKSPRLDEGSVNENVFGLRNSISEADFISRTSQSSDNKTSDNENLDESRYLQKSSGISGTIPPRKLGSKITSLEIPTKEEIIQIFKNEARTAKLVRVSNNTQNEENENASSEDSDDGYETAEEYFSDVEFMMTKNNLDELEEYAERIIPKEKILERINSHKMQQSYQLAEQLSFKWTTGAGPRIGCVRDYPSELQARVMEEVSLSPRSLGRVSPVGSWIPTPSKLGKGTSPLGLQKKH